MLRCDVVAHVHVSVHTGSSIRRLFNLDWNQIGFIKSGLTKTKRHQNLKQIYANKIQARFIVGFDICSDRNERKERNKRTDSRKCTSAPADMQTATFGFG